jgi:hypothetical protein
MLDNNKRGLQHRVVGCDDGLLQWTKNKKEKEEGASYIVTLSGVKFLVVAWYSKR